MCGKRDEGRSSRNRGDRAATARGVHLGDAYEVAGANTHAARAVVGGELGEQLDDLAVHIDGDQAASIRVESGDGARASSSMALSSVIAGLDSKRKKNRQSGPTARTSNAAAASIPAPNRHGSPSDVAPIPPAPNPTMRENNRRGERSDVQLKPLEP